MEFVAGILLGFLSILSQVYSGDAAGINKLNRSSFPPDFLFGASSSAYQVEGAWNIDGKGPSIWDTYTHRYPEKILDHKNGDMAADSYHLYKEDIKLLKDMNMDSYRFSISWSRILPSGKLSGGVNEKGIQYYNNLINHLLANGLVPMVTLFHWDVPQALEDQYGGFLSIEIVNDFYDYAKLCFERFGDRVKHWITLNEPGAFAAFGYDRGLLAPGRCSSWINIQCSGGNSSTEPYIVMHHQLLAHAYVVELYKSKYQSCQNGIIGISLNAGWAEPYSQSSLDSQAAARFIDFIFGWFMDPLAVGDYPYSMKALVGNRLPEFSKKQSKVVKGSYDFIGINYYSSTFVKHNSSNYVPGHQSYLTDSKSQTTDERNGKLIGESYPGSWIHYYPRGLRKLLLYIKTKYHNPLIYITENGVVEINNSTLREAVKDNFRIKYYKGHLSYLHKAILEGVQVKGFYGWSIVDNFEWTAGYTARFGLNYVDFDDGFKRYPKLSAKWFHNFLRK